MLIRFPILILICGLCGAGSRAAEPKEVPTFEKGVKPLLEQYCYACHGNGKHKGDLVLDVYKDKAAVLKDRPVWEHVLKNLRNREMPPENKPQPTQAERDLLSKWIEEELFHVDCDNPDPGRVTLRRLNRAEYNNTIRDLIGVNFQPAADFPMDDVGYGFDNIGDVLSLPPVLLEKYLAAAEKILDNAIVTDGPRWAGPSQKFEAEQMESTAVGRIYGNRARALDREGEIFTYCHIEKEGEYFFRARAFGQQAGSEYPKLEFRVNEQPLYIADVDAVERRPTEYQFRLRLAPGDMRISAGYINNFVDPNNPNPELRDRNLIIDYLEIVGPLVLQPLPETHTRIFTKAPTTTNKTQIAREIVKTFATRAYRRPVSDTEVSGLLGLFEMTQKEGDSFEQGIKIAFEAVLVSPHFLFREEPQPEPDNAKSAHLISEYALASRLSYFLWSTMPDEELAGLAERGELRKNLDAQITRMLRDARSKAFVDNFAAQWLQTRNLASVAPSFDYFPDFDDDLRASMQRETEMFFEAIMREDRSILEFINADYTFVNEKLARHYGIPGVKGKEFQKVVLKDGSRGGLLTQGSILTITSNPTRTSPVKRGKWILENILGTPPPPPPPDVPELSEAKEKALSGSLRQRMEQHRANSLCASCHARMDPIGFGFENFDAVGAWRDKDGAFPIEPGGQLVSGETFGGASDLKKLLMEKKKDEFVRCLSEKTLTYALGRGLEFYDKCALDRIGEELAKNNYRFSTLISEVVKSAPFQKRRGEGDRFAKD